MAFIAVGMVEVSSCVISPDAAPGSHVDKGQETGFFQFGGSTVCMVFRRGAIAEFSLAAIPQRHDPDPPLARVNGRHAVASGG